MVCARNLDCKNQLECKQGDGGWAGGAPLVAEAPLEQGWQVELGCPGVVEGPEEGVGSDVGESGEAQALSLGGGREAGGAVAGGHGDAAVAVLTGETVPVADGFALAH